MSMKKHIVNEHGANLNQYKEQKGKKNEQGRVGIKGKK